MIRIRIIKSGLMTKYDINFRFGIWKTQKISKNQPAFFISSTFFNLVETGLTTENFSEKGRKVVLELVHVFDVHWSLERSARRFIDFAAKLWVRCFSKNQSTFLLFQSRKVEITMRKVEFYFSKEKKSNVFRNLKKQNSNILKTLCDFLIVIGVLKPFAAFLRFFRFLAPSTSKNHHQSNKG